jgi:hypothetical protein
MMAVETQPTNTLEANMESSIEKPIVLDSRLLESASLVAQDWEQAKLVLPSDLERSAQTSRALIRRRGIQCAEDA